VATSISPCASNSSWVSANAGSAFDWIWSEGNKEKTGSGWEGEWGKRREAHDEISQFLDSGAKALFGIQNHPL